MDTLNANKACVGCIHHDATGNLSNAPRHCWDCLATPSRIYFEPRETTMQLNVLDKQIGGNHYLEAGSNMQPWDIARAWRLGAWRHGVLKYILRAPAKNGVQDIEKAIHYLEYIKANYNELKEEGLL